MWCCGASRLWAVALVVTLAVPALHTGERDWWPWACVAGIVLGFIGYSYVRARPRQRRGRRGCAAERRGRRGCGAASDEVVGDLVDERLGRRHAARASRRRPRSVRRSRGQDSRRDRRWVTRRWRTRRKKSGVHLPSGRRNRTTSRARGLLGDLGVRAALALVPALRPPPRGPRRRARACGRGRAPRAPPGRRPRRRSPRNPARGAGPPPCTGGRRRRRGRRGPAARHTAATRGESSAPSPGTRLVSHTVATLPRGTRATVIAQRQPG